MSDRPGRLRLKWQDADRLITAVHSQSPVTGLTHNLYKYPARFSPEFSRVIIEIFAAPGELVADPFVGGGTTLVEARATGRLGIGSDISSLATFVSRAKTRILSSDDLAYLSSWFERLPPKINLHRTSSSDQFAESGYTRNLSCRATWTVRKCVELALAEVRRIRSKKRQDFARCVVLRTAQWALDGRREIATPEQFRQRLSDLAESLVEGATDFARTARAADRLVRGGRHRTLCLNARAEELSGYIDKRGRDQPSLIVTSPPYPGVHVLYHRWQVLGGKETPAPFWIANQLDGSGEAFYVMHAKCPDLTRYYAGIEKAFSGMARMATANTTLVQLVAFSDPKVHLPQYLDVMHQCGFREYLLSDFVDSRDGRLWRNVPSRKWHANKKGSLSSGREVVLIHKPR